MEAIDVFNGERLNLKNYLDALNNATAEEKQKATHFLLNYNLKSSQHLIFIFYF
jgi:hypothetical protein